LLTEATTYKRKYVTLVGGSTTEPGLKHMLLHLPHLFK